MITGVIMLCNYGHGGNEHRGEKKERKKIVQERSRPSITPVTMVLTTITAVIKAVTTSRSFFLSFLFFPCFLHAHDQFSRHDHARDHCPVFS